MMSSCCTLRLKRRRAFSRDSPSCSLTSAKLTHPQTRPAGPNSYYRELTPSQAKAAKLWGQMTFLFLYLHLILRHPCSPPPWPPATPNSTKHRKIALGQSCRNKRFNENRKCQYTSYGVMT